MKLPVSISWLIIVLVFSIEKTTAQNPLFIPPTLTGTDFQLNVQAGTKTFFSGWNTPTYGINQSFLSPTLIFTKGETVSLHVHNGINTTTTMHWHGLHVPAKEDGGPHQIIDEGETWDATFKVMNDAATYWYHPHGEGKTDIQVSKGLAGLIIVKDSNEASMILPRTYGIDDFPLIIQSKAFDILYQIAIASELDTVMMVNGTMNPYLDAPAQVVRLRLLNASSLRNYNFGFSNNLTFHQIATDGGLLNAPVSLTRVRLAPGERAEILVDLGSLQDQTIYLKNFGSELPKGIYGADTVGNEFIAIPEYHLNPLNGADFNILRINVVTPTATPVTTIPSLLNTITPLHESDASITRTFLLAPQDTFDEQEMVEGPFTINGVQFKMDSINVVSYKNTTEIWKFDNQTMIAHPFHIHDVQFFILDANGGIPPSNEQGKKDMVLVMPMQSARVIMKFEDYVDDSIPYMFHCHMLHHEDDGMMGSFLVIDSTNTSILEIKEEYQILIFPNPVLDFTTITLAEIYDEKVSLKVIDIFGKECKIQQQTVAQNIQIDVSSLGTGIYFITVNTGKKILTGKLVKQ